jgi:hypothetical protein
MSLWKLIGNYARHDDPLTAAGNIIALIIAFDQPFYPLTIWWVAGPGGLGVSFIIFLSTPFYLSVPAVARRHPLAARVLLTLTGTANTLLSTKAFGEASGVELFLGPCLMVAALLFRPREWAISFTLIGLLLAVVLILRGRYGVPLHIYSAEQYGALLQVNVFSVAMLTAYLGVALARAQALDGRRR